ncbi:MAG: insulinase family protein [Bacteroidaceae bacterium]|nr:insulinase family protein [Bacteroidaceae bacterium]
MKLRNLMLALLLVCSAGVNAQTPEQLAQAQQMMLMPLPVDKAVRVGHLENGLTYYIRKNQYPAGQADFYIAQKVGSIQEQDSQRGLAHFLEHMCFNGTTSYPGNSLIEYLESIGVKFGEQLNAYTSVEETVYNINSVPVARESTVDSVLLILHDWSHDLLLTTEEIDKERPVIQEEWRMRSSGAMRIFERQLPRLMSESRFGYRLPIGTMDVVMNFPPDTLRAYYHKWYRPDLQGIIVVGDIDVDKIEQKIKALFGPIELPKPLATREYIGVPDNAEAIVVSDKDVELTSQSISLMWKHPATPDSLNNTFGVYVEKFMKNVAISILNQRLNELSLKPECPYNGADVDDGEFIVSSKVTESFNVGVSPKQGRAADAVKAVLAEVYRAYMHGFTQGELDRTKMEILSHLEKLFNDRAKQRSNPYCREYVRAFLDNDAIPGIEMEYQLAQQLMPNLGVQQLNQVFASLVSHSDSNLVVLAMTPEKEGFEVPSEEMLLNTIHEAQKMQLEPWIDNVKTGPLVENLPPAGTIKKETAGPFETKVLTLSNGVRVIMKKTDFKDDEIRMNAWSEGGLGKYGYADRINQAVLSNVIASSKIGGFTRIELGKALAGKQVSCGPNISARSEGLHGSSSVKDVNTLFELIYLHFQPLERDDEAVESFKDSYREQLRNKDANPLSSFNDSIRMTVYDHDWHVWPLKESDIDKINYDRILQIYHERFADASDFTFQFIGNIDEAKIRELSCKYLATLPQVKRKDKASDSKMRMHKGAVTNSYQKKMENPMVYMVSMWNGPIKMSVENEVQMDIFGQCLSTIYLRKIREELGAAYSTQAEAEISRDAADKPQYSVVTVFPLKPALADTTAIIVQQVMEDVAANGVAEEDINKAKEYLLKTYDQNLRENSFWMNRIMAMDYRKYDPFKNYKAVVTATGNADMKRLAKKVLKDGNRVRVILNGTSK